VSFSGEHTTPPPSGSDCVRGIDAAPYVLGALDDADSYRTHLAGCSSCRAEVAELQLVADALPGSVAPVKAPDALRQRVLATVRSEAELLRAAGGDADRPAPAGRWRSRRASWLAVAGAAAAGAAVVVAIAVGTTGSSGVRVTTAQVASSDRGAHAALRQSGSHAELVVTGMQPPPLGKIYEVWLSRRAGAPQPTDALFSVTSRGSGTVAVPDDLHGVREVLVTSEPLGGSMRPTSTPVIRVVLAA